jgi:uncharacterized protein YecE (DUF72 family)
VADVWIGCSGWQYAHWADEVYGGAPRSEWLSIYARQFSTVEVNVSFYRLPPPEAFLSWAGRVPPGFRFTFKGPQYVTHRKQLVDAPETIERYFAHSGPMGPSKLCTLWQLPPRMALSQRNLDKLAAFVAAIAERASEYQAIEFRHPSWYRRDVYDLLAAQKVSLVLPDHARDERMQAQELALTSGFAYLRLHWGTEHGGGYADACLARWAEWIRRRQALDDVDVLVYFNNDVGCHAVRNALTLQERLDSLEARGGQRP